MLIAALTLAAIIALGVFAYMQQPKFGRLPSGERLEKIRQSPLYKNGAFQNQIPTPRTADGVTTFQMLAKFLFGDKSQRTPPAPVPSVKRDLRNLDPNSDLLVWFGHSSYLLQTAGKRILVDPVFSGYASPVPFTTKAFPGSDRYTTDDLPDIDYLILTHDHWDHLDHETVLKLLSKTAKIICPLGVGEHLEYWGCNPAKIIELQWYETAAPQPGLTLHCLPTRHFSGRGIANNKSLWAAFLLETPALKIYIGGDSGYGPHFAETGKRHGPIDLAILENGQYDPHWANIHMMPEDTRRAATELKARHLLPVHNSKFSISNHAWNAPMRDLARANETPTPALKILTPLIGEITDIRNPPQTFPQWWTTRPE